MQDGGTDEVSNISKLKEAPGGTLAEGMTCEATAQMAEAKSVQINDRGQIALPEDILQQLGIKRGDFVTVAVTPDGVLLAPRRLVVQRALDRIGEALTEENLSLEDLIESGRQERTKLIEERYGIKAADQGK